MKTGFAIAGAVVGLLVGVGVMIVSYEKAPGIPGIWELGLQATIVAILAAFGAAAGLLVGWLVMLIFHRK